MLSPNQAAKKAGVSRKTIMNHIRDMSLVAMRNNENHWVIRPTDLANWMKAREKRVSASITPPSTDIDSESTIASPTSFDRIELIKTQVELEYTKKELDAAKLDQERLREEVSDLKAELRQNRNDIREAWSSIREVAKLVILQAQELPSPPEQPASKPFVLTEDLRVVDDDNNIFDDN